jgi:hypothetical protein
MQQNKILITAGGKDFYSLLICLIKVILAIVKKNIHNLLIAFFFRGSLNNHCSKTGLCHSHVLQQAEYKCYPKLSATFSLLAFVGISLKAASYPKCSSVNDTGKSPGKNNKRCFLLPITN